MCECECVCVCVCALCIREDNNNCYLDQANLFVMLLSAMWQNSFNFY